jgi:hypothetical protein
MSCRVEKAGPLAYRFCPESAPMAADRVRAVLSARLVDELTGDPVDVDIGLTTTADGLFPRVARGGLIGLVGRPARLFPALDINPVFLSMRVTAPRYLPLTLGGTIGPIAGFPGQFTPLDLGDAGLHRAAITLSGRTLQRASLTPATVAGATVEIAGYWPGFPPANVSPATVMELPNLLALSPPFYAHRAAGLTQLRRRDVVPVVGQERTLLLPAAAGETRLRLSNRTGLAPGILLVIDRDDPARRERILVTGIDTASASDQPAWVTLIHPLAYTHLDGVVCQPANLLPPGTANPLARAAIPGDETVFLNGMGGLASGITVELDDGGGAPEYHEAALYRTVSDADGHFRLPPLARVAMVLLHAERPGLVSPRDERFTPDYRRAENRLTVMFPS